MGRASRRMRRARASTTKEAPTVTKLRSPVDAIAVVPYLLGFHPLESLVVVALMGERGRLGPTLRVDLVDDPAHQEAFAEQVVSAMTRNGVRRVLFVIFSTHPEVADPIGELVADRFRAVGVDIEEGLRADGERWWSYSCTSPCCAVPGGTPYDAATSPAAADAVLAGMSAAPDRESLRELLAPAALDVRADVAAEIAVLEARGPCPRWTPVELAARLERASADPEAMTAAEIGWLGLAAQDEDARSLLLAASDRCAAEAAYDVWRHVTRHVDETLLPGPGSLAALAAWLSGRGALAWHAVELVQSVDSSEPLTRLVSTLLISATDPRCWPDGDDLADLVG